MDADGLPIVGAAVDLTKVGSIHHKRTLAFLNHFICHTANFLNKFSSVCEAKLEDINIRIQRIEIALCILESKLSSIPGLEDVVVAHKSSPQETVVIAHEQQITPQPSATDTVTADEQIKNTIEADTENTKSDTSPTVTVSQDPRYAKYFKLIQVGVPPMAFRSKMIAEGLNPSLLETPNMQISLESRDNMKDLVNDSVTESDSGSALSD